MTKKQTKQSEPIVRLFPGIPRMGSPEFLKRLKEDHARLNPEHGADQRIPYRLTKKGKANTK